MPSSKRFRVSASSCAEYLNICLNHILLRIIACYILLSIAIDKQLFFCDFDFYRFPISIDNKRLIISIVSDYPSIRYASAYWIFVRTTPIKQGSLPTSGVGSTLFGRVRCSYSEYGSKISQILGSRIAKNVYK